MIKKKFKKAADIRVGVIGYGGAFNMGKGHITMMRDAGMTPVAVAEPVAERLAVAKADFPDIETYSSVSEMLKKSKVNLVTIITPHNTHAPIALECLRAGRHVVCEKPLAITTAEVDSMIRAAEKAGVMLSTFHNRHWDSWILQAVDLVCKKKAIGEVIAVDCHMGGYAQPQDWWRSSKTISGGALYDWGVHLLEYALQLIDSSISEVGGYGHEGFWASKTKWKKDCIEDDAFLITRFTGGQRLTLSISNIESKDRKGLFEVSGTRGTLVSSWDHSLLRTPDSEGKIVEKRLELPPGEAHRYYENIANHLTGKAKLIITPEWSRRPIHILDLAVKSAKSGRTLKAKYE